MGKGTIAGGGVDGLYQVTLDYGQAARDARLAKITADLAALVAKIAAAEALLDAQQVIEDAQKVVVDATINTYITISNAVGPALEAVNAAQNALAEVQADEFATPEDLAAAQATLTAANDAYGGAKAAIEPALKNYTEAATELARSKGATADLRIPLNMLKSEQAQLTKDQATWTALVLTETVPAWCADLTEDASGLVSTIEIPGENKLVLIAPAAPAPGPADGLLTAREVQSPEQVFWNAAVLPGWQKWKPTYRRGTITAIDYDADTANVTLFGDVSSAQQLPINQTANLTAVPVDYMQCDAEAFDVGDVVVVKFTGQDWATPRVIGFCDNPKECGAAAGWFFSAAPGSYGDWSHGRGGEDYEWTASSSKRGGNVSYTSALGTVSWWGSQGITCGSLTPSTGGSVFYRGLNIGVGGLVLGAALAKVGNTKYIVVLSLVTYLNAYVLIKVHATTLAAAVIQSFPVPAGEIAFSWNAVKGKYAYAKAPVFFDELTGLKGATLVYLDGVDDARPRTCEYVVNADLTGATRTVGAPLYIGEGSSSPDSYSQTLRIYAAAYYDVAGDLQTAYAECTSAGGETFTETLDGDGYTIYALHTYTGAWTGSVVCGSETWWTGTSSLIWTYTLEQQLGYPVWSLRTTNRGVSLDGVADMGMDPSDKLGYNVRGFGFNVLCLDPRNPKSLVVEGLFGSGEYIFTERMDNPEPDVFYYTNTTVADAAANDYKAVGEASVVILTDAYEHTATMDKGSPSGAMTADYAGPVIALGVVDISAAGFSRGGYVSELLSHCNAVNKTNVVLLVPAKSGSPFVMVATDFTPATLLGASGLALPTRIYSGTPLLVGVIA
jgi:hypothetical protein